MDVPTLCCIITYKRISVWKFDVQWLWSTVIGSSYFLGKHSSEILNFKYPSSLGKLDRMPSTATGSPSCLWISRGPILFISSSHLFSRHTILRSKERREEKRKDVMAMGKLTWTPFGSSNSGLVRIASNSSFVRAWCARAVPSDAPKKSSIYLQFQVAISW